MNCELITFFRSGSADANRRLDKALDLDARPRGRAKTSAHWVAVPFRSASPYAGFEPFVLRHTSRTPPSVFPILGSGTQMSSSHRLFIRVDSLFDDVSAAADATLKNPIYERKSGLSEFKHS